MVAVAAGWMASAQANDPTRPPGAVDPGQEVALPHVDMVRLRGESRLARIEGRWQSEGESVGAFRIEQIHTDRVVLRREAEQWTVPVLSQDGVQMQRRLPRYPGGKGW